MHYYKVSCVGTNQVSFLAARALFGAFAARLQLAIRRRSISVLRGLVFALLLTAALSSAQAQAPVRVQAEDGTLAGTLGVHNDWYSGYEGTGYVGYFSDNADKLTVTFPSVTAGLYDVRVRYRSNSQVNTVSFNGTLRSEMFEDTGNDWAIKTISRVPLVSGTNAISISKDWGWISVDYIEIAPTAVVSGDDATHKEAENGALSGALGVHGFVPGYQGSGFVGPFSEHGDQLTVNFTGVVAGPYDVHIRYHSGNQVNTVVFNGTQRSELFTDSGSGWAVKTISRVNLVEGANVVAITKDWGWIYIDFIEIAPSAAGNGDTPTHIEAENGVLSGSLSVNGDVLGYQGSGFVGKFANAGDQLEVTFHNVTAGAHDIRIRYRSENQPENLVNIVAVNGISNSETFPNTGGGWADKTVSGAALASGSNAIAIRPWAGWIDVDYIEIAPTTPTGPVPTLSVSRTPSPMVAGETFTLTWNSTDATSVTRSCAASGTGFSGSTTLPTVSGSQTGTAAQAWVGYPSTCTWTAAGPGGTVTATETMTTVAPPLPTLSVSRTPSPMVAGQGFTLTWSTTNATSVTRSCTASGTGFTGSTTMPSVSGSQTGTADQAWVGFPSTCTWTAGGGGGTATLTETMTTTASATPTITVSRAPSPMVAGQSFTVTWNSANATSVTRSCTADGTGFSGSTTMPSISSSETGTADQAWVGFPSTCTWTATGAGGSASTTETLTTVAPAVATGPVRYFYDESSRLVQAVAPNGQSIKYTYDAVGNILSIENQPAATSLSISEFTPNEGSPGATVRIYGTGFSGTPSQNVVQVNGVTAIVSAASPTSLVIAVPAGASSGPISVANANGSVTSAAAFNVLPSAAPPTVSGFSPVFGITGDVVAITGSGFQQIPRTNSVTLSGTPATVVRDMNSPTATTLKFVVPENARTGKVAVGTDFGTATSTGDFIVLPDGVAKGDVDFTARLVVDGPPVTVMTTSPGKVAVLIFDAAAGQVLRLRTSSGTFASPFHAVIYEPGGRAVTNIPVGNQSESDFTLVYFGSGTYSIVLTPQATQHGSLSVSLNTPVFDQLTVDGSTAIGMTAGSYKRYAFASEAGRGYGAEITGLVGSPSLFVQLFDGAGNRLGSCSVPNGVTSCTFPPESFTGGTYYLGFRSESASSFNFNVVLSRDVTGVLTGTPTTVTIAREGQNAHYTFSGTQGQAIRLLLSNFTLDDGIQSTNDLASVRLYGPIPGNTSSISPPMGMSNYSSTTTYDTTLPATGTYAVRVDPYGMHKGTFDAAVKPFLTGSLAVDGTTPVSLASGVAGRYSFVAEAGKGYGLALTNLSITPPDRTLSINLRRSDYVRVGGCFVPAGSTFLTCAFAPLMFATSGTYFVDFVSSGVDSTATFDAVFSRDVTGELTVNASSATAVAIVRPGQNARLTFAGTVGQTVTFHITENTLSGFIQADNTIRTITSSEATKTFTQQLSRTGTHTFQFDPQNLETGAFNVRLSSN